MQAWIRQPERFCLARWWGQHVRLKEVVYAQHTGGGSVVSLVQGHEQAPVG